MEPVGRLSVPYIGYTSLVFNIKRWTLAAKLSKASHLSARFPVLYDGCNVHQVYIQLQILPRNRLTSTSLAFGFMCMFSRKGQQQSHSLLYDSDSIIFVCTNRDWPRTIQKCGKGICSRQVKSARPGPYLPRLLTLELPLVTKTEFLLTISIQYPTDKWWE